MKQKERKQKSLKLNCMKISSILFMAIIFSATMIKTTAQTSVKPAAYIVNDTAKQTEAAVNSFDVQIITENQDQRFILSISNPFAEKLTISISSNSGVGFNDNTKSFNYRKRFNMEGAEDGNYTITVSGDKKKFVKTIAVQTTTNVNRSISLQ
jgi:hypothetical protein